MLNRSPIIGLKDFAELLDLCAHLYSTVDYLPVTLHYPRYWRVQNMSEGKLRFYQTEKFRFKPQPARPDLKRKKTADERSESPDAKRRKSGVPIKINLSINKASTMPTTTQNSLPSPGALQPSITIMPRQASPLQHESPNLQAPAVLVSPAPPRKQASPAISKKPSPATSRASPATSRASPAAKAARKQKRVVLKFNHKRKEYASLVNSEMPDKVNMAGAIVPYADDDDEEDDAPLASRAPAVQTNGAPPVKAEMAPPPPPLSSIPAPNNMEPERKTSETPPPPQKVKLKLKFGGGGK